MNEQPATPEPISRRQFFGKVTRTALAATLAGAAGAALMKSGSDGAARLAADPARTLWQIDPLKCIQCGRCRTNCVLEDSAVKCVHDFRMCGYCELCTGFFYPDARTLTEGAENQLCPVGAIQRTWIEGEFFEYRIDDKLCTGCGICVKGCTNFGNGSLYLQVRQDRCLNCNDCNIAAHCPADAFMRVPAAEPYVLKREWVGRKKPDYKPFQKPPQLSPKYRVPTFQEGLEGHGT